MSDSTSDPKTPLDAALEAAVEDPSQADPFYEEFLRTELFFPIWGREEDGEGGAEGAGPASPGLGEERTISPIAVEAEGLKLIPVFDRQERLVAWADREMTWIAMAGHALVTAVGDGEVGLALNIGTGYLKVFDAEEVASLAESVLRGGEKHEVDAGTEILLGRPTEIPEGLVESVGAELERTLHVTKAYLLRIHITGEESSGYALVVDVTDEAKEHFEEIRRAMTVAGRGLVPEGDYLTVLPAWTDPVGGETLEEFVPFFERELPS